MITRRAFLKVAPILAMPAIVHAAPNLSFFGKSTGCNTATNAQTTDWLSRMSGSAGVTQNTKNAANCFANSLDAAGLSSHIIAMNFWGTPSDQSTLNDVARYAFKKGGGSDPWGITAFVLGDLTVNGLKGDGSSKFFNTGLTGAMFASNANAGITTYIYTPGTATNNPDTGYTNDAGSDAAVLYSKFGGNADAGIWPAGFPGISVATPGAGYYSVNRTATNVTKLYFANSSTPHAQIGTTDATLGTANGAHSFYVFSTDHWTSGTPTDAGFSDCRMSFWAIHDGWTQTQSAAFFSMIQKLRQNLGGGFV